MPISNSPTPKPTPKPQRVNPNEAVLDAYYALQDEMLLAHQAYNRVRNASDRMTALLGVWKTAKKDPEIEDFDAIEAQFETLAKHVDSFLPQIESIKPRVAEFEKLLSNAKEIYIGDEKTMGGKDFVGAKDFVRELEKIKKALIAVSQSRGWTEIQQWSADIRGFRTTISQIRKLRLRELASFPAR